MLLKGADDKGRAVAELKGLVAAAPAGIRSKIEQELRLVQAGIEGERESAYLIDFDFRNRKNWIAIHDLRLEHGGRVAQIDHLMMNRLLECYVLETKHFTSGMKVTEDGEFLRWNDFRKTYGGMASPLAQNERHMAVLRDVFGEICTPTRLGVQITPSFHSIVLVSPKARIDRPKKFDTSRRRRRRTSTASC
ncbi:MAG: NERD domain-containing protein [Deltaproteobacteria bacterium]|nr:NERD domain-containing protein [Deltaproteobacteria bacterium]